MLEVLSDGEGKSLGTLSGATASLWHKNAASQNYMMVYEIMRWLHSEGRIRFETTPVNGVIEGTIAPRKMCYLTQ